MGCVIQHVLREINFFLLVDWVKTMEKHKITLQQVFNAGWKTFVIDNRQLCMNEKGCLYSDGKGNRCVIGLCLPDNHPALESRDLVELIVLENESFEFDGPIGHFRAAQRILHDLLDKKKAFADGCLYENLSRRERYELFASNYGLQVPE